MDHNRKRAHEAVRAASMLTYQCEWARHTDCPEPRHCLCLCHRPYAAAPSWRERARRVWGRWT